MNDIMFHCFLCKREVRKLSDLERYIGDGFVLVKYSNMDELHYWGDELPLCEYCRDSLNKAIQSCME